MYLAWNTRNNLFKKPDHNFDLLRFVALELELQTLDDGSTGKFATK